MILWLLRSLHHAVKLTQRIQDHTRDYKSTCTTATHILLLTHISLLPWVESGWKLWASRLWCHFMLMLHYQVLKLCTFIIMNQARVNRTFCKRNELIALYVSVVLGGQWCNTCWWSDYFLEACFFLSTAFLINTSCNAVCFALLTSNTHFINSKEHLCFNSWASMNS